MIFSRISKLCCISLYSVPLLTACNSGSTALSNPSVANIPYLIEANLTESSLQTLISIVNPVQYSINYLLNPEGGHSTIAYAPSDQQYNNLEPYLTNNMHIVVSEYCWSDQFGVEAARGTVYNSNNVQIVGTDPFQHITISFESGKAAVDSNYLFECSSSNYNNYPYCAENNLYITDLTCTQLANPITFSATLYQAY